MKLSVTHRGVALLLLIQAPLLFAATKCQAATSREGTLSSVQGSSPIVLIPGFAASVLEVQYDYKWRPPRFWCSRSSHGNWERVWGPKPTDLIPKLKDCWWHKTKVYYSATRDNQTTDHHSIYNAHNAPGVKLRVKPGVEGLEVEPNQNNSNVYRQLLREFPQTQVLTYDFRLSPTGNPTIVQQIQTMIQDAYWKNNCIPVTIISHSYGALLVHHVLTKTVSRAWKEQYVHAWIPMAPAYGGVTATIQDVLSGDTRTLNPFFRDTMYKEVVRSFEASFWMLPPPAMYANETLVELQPINGSSESCYYSGSDYTALFADAGFTRFDFMWQRIQNLTSFTAQGQLADPGVAVYPIYGTGIETVVKYVYHGSFDSEPDAITDWTGDGTIQGSGLVAGNHWDRAGMPLELVNTTHVEVCWHRDALDHIWQITNLTDSLLSES